MPRVNDRRVAHKSTGGIPPEIPTPVGPVGNAPNHLTPNTVALSANQSVHCADILEKAETPREMRRSFSAQRTGESRLTPGSPDWASLLSVRNKHGSLQRPECALAAFAQPSPSRDRKLNLNQSCLSVRERPRQIDAAENRTLLHAESVALRRPFERQIDAVEQRLGVLLPLADRFHDWGCSERQAPLRFLRSGAELWLTNVLVFSLGNRLRVAAFNVRRRGGTQR